MSQRTRAMCAKCWNEYNPERQIDVTAHNEGPDETCCYCFALTNSGIYYRSDPATTKCGGTATPIHAEDR